MRLNNIKIKNFRCFEKVSIDFDKHITLIVGKERSRKDSVIGCCGCFNQFFFVRN